MDVLPASPLLLLDCYWEVNGPNPEALLSCLCSHSRAFVELLTCVHIINLSSPKIVACERFQEALTEQEVCLLDTNALETKSVDYALI